MEIINNQNKLLGDDIRKESREFFIPFEIKLRNKLTPKAIAKECAN